MKIDRLFEEVVLPVVRPVTGYIVGEMLVREHESQRHFIDLQTLQYQMACQRKRQRIEQSKQMQYVTSSNKNNVLQETEDNPSSSHNSNAGASLTEDSSYFDGSPEISIKHEELSVANKPKMMKLENHQVRRPYRPQKIVSNKSPVKENLEVTMFGGPLNSASRYISRGLPPKPNRSNDRGVDYKQRPKSPSPISSSSKGLFQKTKKRV